MSIENARRAASDIDVYGDAIDARRSKSTMARYGKMSPIIPGSILSSLAFSTIDRQSAVLATAVVVPTVASAFWVFARNVKTNTDFIKTFHQRNIEARADQPTLQVDVIACEEGNKLLYHEHPLKIEKTDEDENGEARTQSELADLRTAFDPAKMRTVANHAQDIDIDKVVFEVTDDIRDRVPVGRLQTLTQWFQANKSPEMDMSATYDSGQWVELDVVELHQLANDIERDLVTPEMERYIDILRARGRSRIPDQFDRYKLGEMSIETFLKLVDYEFCTEGQDTVMYRELDRLSGENTFVKEGTFLSRKGDTVTEIAIAYDGSNTRVQSRTLLGIVGAEDRDHLYDLLKDEELDVTDTAEQRARVAVMLSLRDNAPLDEEEGELTHESLLDAVARNETYRFHNRKSSFRRQMGATACIGAVFALALYAPTRAADYSVESAATMHKLYEAQSPALKSQMSYKEFISQAKGPEAAAAHIFQEKNDLLTSVANVIDPNRIGLPEGYNYQDSMSVGGRVGDVVHSGKDEEVFTVKGINGASTDGYWGQYVGDNMSFPTNKEVDTSNWKNKNFMIENTGSGEGEPSQPVFRPLPMSNSDLLKNQVPHIEVTHDSSFETLFEPYPLTIKAGTAPAAAVYTVSIEGAKSYEVPVSVFRNGDNEWYASPLDYSKLNDGHFVRVGLKYWLAYSDSSALRASAPVGFSDGKWVGDLSSYDTSGTSLKLGKDPVNTIRQKTYSLTPLGDEGMSEDADDYNSIDAYGEKLASLKSANCNVATTELLIATRGKNKDGGNLNPAIGYHNDGDGSIKTSEAHMWTVDSYGGIIDPTPFLSQETEFAADKQEGNIDWYKTIKYGSAITLIGGMALMGYRKRKSFVNAAHSVRNAAAKRSHKIVSENPKPIDGVLLGRLQHSLYSHPDSKHAAPIIDTSQVDKTLDVLPAVTYEEASRMVGELNLRDKLHLGKLTLAAEYRTGLRTADMSQ